MVLDSLEMADYIESAVDVVGGGLIKYGSSYSSCKSSASCRSCGGGCYGCKGSKSSKSSKGASASIPQRFKKSQLIAVVEEVNN